MFSIRGGGKGAPVKKIMGEGEGGVAPPNYLWMIFRYSNRAVMVVMLQTFVCGYNKEM